MSSDPNHSVLERRKSEISLLRDFEEAGELVICKEFGEDIAEIAQLAQRIDENGLLQAVALDPFGVGAIVDALYDVGIGGQDRVIGITQGWKLTGAIKTAERKLADGTLRHGGQKLMAWAVGNARVEPKGNAHHNKAGIRNSQDRSADGSAQRYRLDGGEPGVGAAEHILDIGPAPIFRRRRPYSPLRAGRRHVRLLYAARYLGGGDNCADHWDCKSRAVDLPDAS
jgi:hypothetical protein